MNIFDELEAQYNEIEEEYSTKERKARKEGSNDKELEYQRKRELNDQAYFLFMFSRLEDHVRTQSSELIEENKKLISNFIEENQEVIKDRRQRAAWDLLTSFAQGRLPFKGRLALLIEADGDDYKLILDKYYKERNSIAHGGGFTKPISMPIVISKLKELYKVLKV